MCPRKKKKTGALLGFVSGLVLLAGGACEEAPVVYEPDPYEGEAFPDRSEPVAYPASPALVTNSLSDTISILDLDSMTVVDERPVGRNPIDIDGPHHVTVDEAKGVAFIALSYPTSNVLPGPHATHGSSTAFGWVQKLSLDDFGLVGQARVDPNPGDIVLSPDAKHVVVSHFDLQRAIDNPTELQQARARLAVIATDSIGTDALDRRYVTTCVAPHGMVFGGDGLLYVACYGEDVVARVDLADSASVPELLELGPGAGDFGAPNFGPYALLASPDGAWIAVSNTISDDVRFLEVATGTIDDSRTLFTNGAPFFPAFDADGATFAIVTQQPDAIRVIEMATGEELVAREFVGDECELPHIVVHEGVDYLVVCEGDKESPGKVVRLDPALSIVGEATVGLYPDAIVTLRGGDR
jgi:DNA-binding beta-propeller fold protein YncE